MNITKNNKVNTEVKNTQNGRFRVWKRIKTSSIVLAMLTLTSYSNATISNDHNDANLALFAKPCASDAMSIELTDVINDGFEPKSADDNSHGAFITDPGTRWVELDWNQPITTRKMDVYWLVNAKVRVPSAYRLSYWDGNHFVAVKNAVGLGLAVGHYNTTTFDEITTNKLRLEFDATRDSSLVEDWMLKQGAGIIEWKVYDSGKSPKFALKTKAGPDRVVVLPAKTYLMGKVIGKAESVMWSKVSGPGEVKFKDCKALNTTAQFAKSGKYMIKLSAINKDYKAADTLNVLVELPTLKKRLNPVSTQVWKINSPLWNERLKQQIMGWIPHCIDELLKPDLKEGGIENFIQAGNKLAGRSYKFHVGAVFSDVYTINILESMCLALMVDPQGDAELASAQAKLSKKLEEWIPIVLSAQEPDGYLQTRITQGYDYEQLKPAPRWGTRGEHEGYVAGFFLDAAIAHYWMTKGSDLRMYHAAKKLADCWDANVGPESKKIWFDGCPEIEESLVRFAQLVNEVEGNGKGDKYIRLAKYQLDCRGNGESYDQSHLPVVQQYEAMGHAVRAVYCYAGMAEVAMETGDARYQSAVKSIWSNLINTKYYITGGIGSGATAEGFGEDISLPNNSYCESCASCGELFFQHKMNMAYHEARYADLMEESLFNAILGSVDLSATNFTYENPLDQSYARYPWHACPCCVGNISRTLLMLPTWMYSKSTDGLFVNQYIGSVVKVGSIAGTNVEMVQNTDYPWKSKVEMVVNPSSTKKFTIYLRLPNRDISVLYHATPESEGIKSLAVNGKPIVQKIKDGYAIINREWKASDKITFEIPLLVQRVKADNRIIADLSRVALRYGPVIYNIESVDQDIDGVLKPDALLKAEWKPDLLGGVVAISGTFADGKSLLAIPNYARNNRGGRSIVWIKDE